MISITNQKVILKKAIAKAVISLGSKATVKAVVDKKVPKGDVLEMAKTAGLFAAKRTADMIPGCFPMPIEYTAVKFDIQEQEIHAMVEIQTIYKTGVEVEAMHAASVVALTMYDMLKPLDNNISITQISLVDLAGTTENPKDIPPNLQAAVISCSDSVVKGKKEDRAGKAIVKNLEQCEVIVKNYKVLPDDLEVIKENLMAALDTGVDLVVFTGGTGLSARDTTTEALRPLLEKEIPGIEEAIRRFGQERTPHAMFSRSVAGLIGSTLVLALPGSSRGAEESMDAIFPEVLHLFRAVKELGPC